MGDKKMKVWVEKRKSKKGYYYIVLAKEGVFRGIFGRFKKKTDAIARKMKLEKKDR